MPARHRPLCSQGSASAVLLDVPSVVPAQFVPPVCQSIIWFRMAASLALLAARFAHFPQDIHALPVLINTTSVHPAALPAHSHVLTVTGLQPALVAKMDISLFLPLKHVQPAH